jgi:hemoglobin/transferrin/lactoferrin receptor protein
VQSSDDIFTGLAKLDHDFGNGLRLGASWQSFRNTALEPNNGQGIAPSDPVLRALVEKDVLSDTTRLTAAFAPAGSRLIDLEASLYAVSSAVDEIDPATGRATVRDIDTTGFTIANVMTLADGPFSFDLAIGADWREDAQVGTDSATGDRTREGVPNGETRFIGAFAEARLSIERPFGLPGRLIGVPAVRWDRFESQSGTQPGNADEAVSPKLGVMWRPMEAVGLFANWGEAFRAPSINELYLTGIHFRLPHPVLGPPRVPPVFVTNLFVPNPNLRPEQASSREWGVDVDARNLWQPGDRLGLRAVQFQTDVDDLIDLSVNVSFPATCFARPTFLPCNAGTTDSRNVARARLEGWELEASYATGPLRASFAYGEVEGRNRTTGAFLGILTPPRWTLDLSGRLLGDTLTLGTRIRAAGDFRQTASPAQFRDAYAVPEFYARWLPDRGPLEGLRLDLAVENAGDERYQRTFAGVAEPGRSVKLTVSWQGRLR